MPPEKLVIIDYCGTLSLEATRFGWPENLNRALEMSGLAALGVSTPEAFWSDIVDPTWVEGSTTAIGYAKVMADRIASLGLASSASAGEVEAAASRFVSLYLDSSRIDPRWQPLLTGLSRHPAAITVIATDHYAEATAKITGYLDSWGIPATPLPRETFEKLDRERNPQAPSFGGKKDRFFVANSADLGAWKQDRRFWETLGSQLPLAMLRQILLIDDFGFNEAPGDSYGEQARVLARRKKTVAHLGETFLAVVEVAPFELPGAYLESDEAAARLIEDMATRIDAFLEERK